MLSPALRNRVGGSLGLAVVALSFAAPLFQAAAPTHPLVAAGVRLCIAALLLAPYAVVRLRRTEQRGRLLRAAALGGLLYAVHFGAWVTSLTLTTVAASVTLVTATPLVLAAVALITGRDRAHRQHWMAIALATAGLACIGGADLGNGAALTGDLLALLGALAMAGYLLVVRSLGPTLDVVAFAAVSTATGAVALLSGALLLGVPLEVAHPTALFALLAAAAVPQLVGHTLLAWSLRHVRPTVVGLATVGEPVGATAITWLWRGELPSTLVLVGCSITLAAVVLGVLAQDDSARQVPRRSGGQDGAAL